LPLLIIGHDALTRSDTAGILSTAQQVATSYKFINAENGWNGYNVLHRSQGEVNALELGLEFRPPAHKPKVIFLLGCDNGITPEDIPKDAFVVYIGSHGDQGAQYADVILPAAAYTERSGTYGTLQAIQ
jgi:NADH dehydrogenase (ubiquinone) Fe-S protein 1